MHLIQYKRFLKEMINLSIEDLKKDILRYSYYNEQHKLVVILNQAKLKELFDADEIYLEEPFE